MASADLCAAIPAPELGANGAASIRFGKQAAEDSEIPTLRRSVSQHALFNEPVYPVPIMDLPVSSLFDEGSQRISVSCSPHRGPLAHLSSTVEVRDVLLGVSFEVQAGQLSTVKELKHQIQCVQGRNGYRIIPSHAQQISIDGYELRNGALVYDHVDSDKDVLFVEPRVTELFSFFLSSVSSLHCPKSPACLAQPSPSASSRCSSAGLQSSASTLGLQTCSDGDFLMDPFEVEPPHMLMGVGQSRRYPRSTASSESVPSSLQSSPAHSPPFGFPMMMGMQSPPTGMLFSSLSGSGLIGITCSPPQCKDKPKSSKGVLVMPEAGGDAMGSPGSKATNLRRKSSEHASSPLAINEEERSDEDSISKLSTPDAKRLRDEHDASDAQKKKGLQEKEEEDDVISDSSLVFADSSFVCTKDLSSPPPPPRKHDPTPAKDVPLPRPSSSAWRPRSLRVLINEWEPPSSSSSSMCNPGSHSASSVASGKDTVSACSFSWSEGEEMPGCKGLGGGGGSVEDSKGFAPGTSYTGKSILSSLFSPNMKSGGMLDARMLRAVGEAGAAYSSHTHLILSSSKHTHRHTLALLEARRAEMQALEQLVLEVQSGLRHGHTPEEMMGELVGGCCGGTYILRNNAGEKAAVFKPMDEEPYAPRNPKGFSSGSMHAASAMRAGIPVGGGAFRECAAYLLDKGGFAQVPSTTMLRITHSTILANLEAEVQIKAGSVQRFCAHECTSEDVGTASFAADQVHAIGIFDVRTFNMDRNSDNVLYSTSSKNGKHAKATLVPIDHGYILPSLLHLEEVVACWLHWPQAKLPFSKPSLSYIENLDAEADMEMLRSALGISEESLMTLFLGTSLIKLAAAAGLTLHQAGKLMLRGSMEEPSAIEEVVKGALEAIDSTAGAFPESDAEREHLKRELRERLTALVAAVAQPSCA